MLLTNFPTPERRVLMGQYAVGIASGKMLVVQQPHLHLPLLAFTKDQIHILPPRRAAEALMRAGLHTYGPDTALINFFNFLLKNAVLFTMLPEKRRDIIFAGPIQCFLQSRVHLSISFTLRFYSAHPL